ncbi:MAG: hypothetical protein GYB45_11895 [Gammaproteobacteria bacterium]|nr:hypothetical protein [Gammaproteobacteria bacterium]
MIRLLAVTFLVLSAQVGAQNLHVFEDGQTIDAKRFNENFAALKNGAASSEPDADNVAVIGRPVWVDSNGNVITGREDTHIWWRLNGDDTRVGIVSGNVYNPAVGTLYYTEADCAGTEYVDKNPDMIWADGGTWKTNGEALTITRKSIKYLYAAGPSCDNGEYETEVAPIVDTGLAAPSWTSDGTTLYPAFR